MDPVRKSILEPCILNAGLLFKTLPGLSGSGFLLSTLLRDIGQADQASNHAPAVGLTLVNPRIGPWVAGRDEREGFDRVDCR